MISYAEARVEAAKVALFEAQQYYAALEEQYNADSQQLSALFADYKAARDAGDEVAIEGVLQPLGKLTMPQFAGSSILMHV